MQGEASFAQVITRDKLSRLHLVMAAVPASIAVCCNRRG